MTRVLVVEDSDLAQGLCANLEMEGYDVELAVNGREALDLARAWKPDLLLLDMMLPDLDGLHVLRTLRREAPSLAVLVLTARAQESDKVVALKLGADDYLTKPFGLLELLARVEALLRRSGVARDGQATHRFGDVELHGATRSVLKAGEPVDLTPKEFDLLRVLLGAGGAVVPRDQLLRQVWGYRSRAATRTLDTHVAELRRKLEPEAAAPRYILTVRKIGYRIAV